MPAVRHDARMRARPVSFDALVDDLAGDFPDQAFEVIYGGQALYSYFIGIE